MVPPRGGGGRDEGGALGGPGGAGSGREELSDTGGRGALVRDAEGAAGKPLLADSAERGNVELDGGRNGAPPTCRLGPLLVVVVEALSSDVLCRGLESHLLLCGGGGGGCAAPFTLRPTSTSAQHCQHPDR